ncbi:hypothetical protein JNJ66_05800 [Candidatus Saccharibacteria bacterium]|nr:hypothetical protein [Candidatus Saccharibacteria bacterium]
MADGERLPEPRSAERHNDLAEAAGEQLERLKKSPENSAERDAKSQERAAEHARKQAELEAVFGKEAGGEKKGGGEPGPSVKPVATKKTKQQEYQQTMTSVQSKLTPASRSFSKIIHTPAVEKASEVIGSSIARPNQILFGSLTALVLMGATYGIAHYIGFPLSGTEPLLAFLIGWVLGSSFDTIRLLFRGKRPS